MTRKQKPTASLVRSSAAEYLTFQERRGGHSLRRVESSSDTDGGGGPSGR